MSELAALTDEFNACVNKLVKISGDLIKQGGDVKSVALFDTSKKKINMIINTDPVFLLDSAGSYLYKYREYLSSMEEKVWDDLILNTDKYIKEDDKTELDSTKKSLENEGSVNCAESIIEHLRSHWSNFQSVEKKIVMKNLKKMLSTYCKFLLYNAKSM